MTIDQDMVQTWLASGGVGLAILGQILAANRRARTRDRQRAVEAALATARHDENARALAEIQRESSEIRAHLAQLNGHVGRHDERLRALEDERRAPR